jgi:hypothetical protein
MDLVIDPGQTQTGIAVYMPGLPAPWCAKIKQPATADVSRVLRWALAFDAEFTLVIEGQHLRVHGPAHKINWPSITTLMLSAHRWIVLAEHMGVRVEVVQPAEWQGPMFASIPKKDAAGEPLSTKKRSKLYVAKQWLTVGRLELGHVNLESLDALGPQVPATKIAIDECDAAVMGRWWRLHGSARRPPE